MWRDNFESTFLEGLHMCRVVMFSTPPTKPVKRFVQPMWKRTIAKHFEVAQANQSTSCQVATDANVKDMHQIRLHHFRQIPTRYGSKGRGESSFEWARVDIFRPQCANKPISAHVPPVLGRLVIRVLVKKVELSSTRFGVPANSK